MTSSLSIIHIVNRLRKKTKVNIIILSIVSMLMLIASNISSNIISQYYTKACTSPNIPEHPNLVIRLACPAAIASAPIIGPVSPPLPQPLKITTPRVRSQPNAISTCGADFSVSGATEEMRNIIKSEEKSFFDANTISKSNIYIKIVKSKVQRQYADKVISQGTKKGIAEVYITITNSSSCKSESYNGTGSSDILFIDDQKDDEDIKIDALRDAIKTAMKRG